METKVVPIQCPPDEYAPRTLQHMTYRNDVSDPIKFPEPESVFELERHFVHVTSADRDRSRFPDAGSFRVTFPEPYRDVLSVALLKGVVPNAAIQNDPYVLLDVPEFNHISSTGGGKYFAVLGFLHHIVGTTYYNVDVSSTNMTPLTFKPPRSRLDGFTLTLRHPDRTQVTFGDEDPLAPIDFSQQVQFTFEIRTKVRKRPNLERDWRTNMVT